MAERRTTEPNVGGQTVHSENVSSVGGSYSSNGRGSSTSRRSSSSSHRSSTSSSSTTAPADWSDFNTVMFELPHIDALPEQAYESYDNDVDAGGGFELTQANVADRWLPGWLPGFYDVINNWKNWY